jgi:hypothetical protein
MKHTFHRSGLLLLAAALANLSPASAQSEAQTTPQLQEAQRRQDAIEKNPFGFHGKVVDESGNPVAGATAKFEIATSTAPLQEVKVLSDEKGMFSIKNVRAVDVHVLVYKDDYYTVSEAKSSDVGRGWGLNSRTFPTETNPATWILRKKMAAEPLIEWKAYNMDVAPDGTIASFNPAVGHKQKGFVGGIEVQTWIDSHDQKSLQPFHWKIRVSVPNGGLFERNDDYQFLAPTTGYQESDEIELGLPGGRWTDVWSRKYFVKLADGRFGRIDLTVVAKGFFHIDGFLNPSGSQNLEFDATKQLKARPL